MKILNDSTDYFHRTISRNGFRSWPSIWVKTDNGYRIFEKDISSPFVFYACPPVPELIENLIQDWDMQNPNLSSWSTFGIVSYQKTTHARPSIFFGNPAQSMLLYNNAQNAGLKQSFSVTPGERYTGIVELFVNNQYFDSTLNSIYVYMYDETNARIISSIASIANPYLPSVLGCTMIAPSGCYEASIRIQCLHANANAVVTKVITYRDQWNFSFGVIESQARLNNSGQLQNGVNTYNNEIMASFNRIDTREVTVTFKNTDQYFSKLLANSYRREILLDRYSLIYLFSYGVGYQPGAIFNAGNGQVGVFSYKNIFSGKCINYSLSSKELSITLRET